MVGHPQKPKPTEANRGTGRGEAEVRPAAQLLWQPGASKKSASEGQIAQGGGRGWGGVGGVGGCGGCGGGVGGCGGCGGGVGGVWGEGGCFLQHSGGGVQLSNWITFNWVCVLKSDQTGASGSPQIKSCELAMSIDTIATSEVPKGDLEETLQQKTSWMFSPRLGSE